VTRATRETLSDWLMTLSAPILFGSLFLTWSHQFSRSFVSQYGASSALRGIPRDPDAWQVYSAADVLLALLGAGLLALALWGGRLRRLTVALALAVALAFTLHASSSPPTNSVPVFVPSLNAPAYASSSPSSGPGVIVALVALGLGIAGVLLSYSADR
jgi:fatty acid desaturase